MQAIDLEDITVHYVETLRRWRANRSGPGLSGTRSSGLRAPVGAEEARVGARSRGDNRHVWL
jgi:hypothetical protein